MKTISTFEAQQSALKSSKNGPPATADEPLRVAKAWGIDEEFWDRNWSTLSGGESQRISLAIAVGLRCADILLLDEPTSALDAQTSTAVEEYLTEAVKSKEGNLSAIIWITHSEEQGRRVGTRYLRIAGGRVVDEPVDSAV